MHRLRRITTSLWATFWQRVPGNVWALGKMERDPHGFRGVRVHSVRIGTRGSSPGGGTSGIWCRPGLASCPRRAWTGGCALASTGVRRSACAALNLLLPDTLGSLAGFWVLREGARMGGAAVNGVKKKPSAGWP